MAALGLEFGLILKQGDSGENFYYGTRISFATSRGNQRNGMNFWDARSAVGPATVIISVIFSTRRSVRY